jgi:putative ABC transport system ATP-binding protein
MDEPEPNASPPVVSIEGLSFRYRSGEFRLAIEQLSVAAGTSVAVIGPSGSGKTTLLNLVAGILEPDAGRIVVDGTEIGDLSDAARRAFRISKIGLVFQEFELLDYLSVLDNILLPYRIAPSLSLDGPVRERATSLAGTVGLSDKLHRSTKRLSQGERQRVGVCRALLTEPPLILADEPTGNLDPANKGRVLDIVFERATASGATLLTVTHDHALLDRFDRTLDVNEWGRG